MKNFNLQSPVVLRYYPSASRIEKVTKVFTKYFLLVDRNSLKIVDWIKKKGDTLFMTKDKISNYNFEALLEESVKTHGHLCPGQVLGVRMSMLGLRKIGIDDPKGKDRKSLIVFVEMDRCATDAVQSVTGCSLGHRTMKFMDYGKMAAAYLNLKTNNAVRVIAREDSRDKARNYFPDIEDKYKAQLEAYKIMSDEELFDVMDVKIEINPEDMPGKPLRRVKCEKCGEHVQDMRDLTLDGRIYCRACAKGTYYKVPEK